MSLTPWNRQEEWYQEMIDAIGEGGGSGLPEVTSADNGKVLTVENGAWTADSNLFVVTLSGSPLKSDKTYAEIVAAVDEGRTVIAEHGSTLFQFAGYNSNEVDFVKFTANGTTVMKRAVLKSGRVDSFNTATVPTPFAADNGSELIVKNGAWEKQQKKFIVTLTPTAQDYSGTMDKTVAEIDAAYKAGRQVVFHLLANASQWYEMDSTERGGDSSTTYPSYNACGIVGSVFGKFYTGTTDDGTKATYSANIFTLTPAT